LHTLPLKGGGRSRPWQKAGGSQVIKVSGLRLNTYDLNTH